MVCDISFSWSCFLLSGMGFGSFTGLFLREGLDRLCVVLPSIVAFHLALANSYSSYIAPYPEQKCELQR